MPEFLLIYDRDTGAGHVTRIGHLPPDRLEQTCAAVEALAAPNEEVVMLNAESVDSIRVDHTRTLGGPSAPAA